MAGLALALGTVLFGAGTFALPEHSFAVHVYSDAGWTLASGLAAFRCFVLARRLPLASHRRAFFFFGAACLSWWIGILLWDYDELVRRVYTPFPAVSDVFFLALVPLYLAGFASYGSEQPNVPLGLRRVGDLVMILATMIGVSSLVFGNLPEARHSSGYAVAAFAYPVMHLSGLVFAVLSLWYRRFPRSEMRVLTAMLASLLAFTGVNVVYGYTLLAHTYEAGRALDVFWFLGFALVLLATCLATRVEPEDAGAEVRDVGILDGLIAPVSAATVCGTWLAFSESLRRETMVAVALAGIAFCIGAAIRAVAVRRFELELREAVRQRERQLIDAQRMEAVATLAGGLAHDFNNLLTGIMAGAGMLKLKGNVGPAALPYVEMVEQSAIRASELTRRLLALARRREVTYVTTRPRDLVRRVASLLRSALPETVVVREEGGPAERTFRADAGLLEQALLNLGINAGHAMPNGGELRFVVEEVARDPRLGGPAIVFHVIDSGVGIPESIRDRVFDPFFTTRGEGEGSGLGLAMVRATVEDHGGYVDLQSEVGTGTRFRMVIPLVEAARTTPEPPSVEVEFPPGQETILVVDDRGAPLLAAKTVLETAGYRVLTAESVEGALAMIDRGIPVDLVLTDAVMPGGGARELREGLSLRRRELPVVVMSGHGSLADVGPGEVVRIDKPFLPSELARTVRLVLDRPRGPERVASPS